MTLVDRTEETIATARRYLDSANKELGRMAGGVLLMAEELRELRKRCLCRGSFRCTPCLEAMEEDGTRQVEIYEVSSDILLSLELLRLLPPATPITCHQCGGSAPEPEFCGCGGKQTVSEAIRWYESQLEILSK